MKSYITFFDNGRKRRFLSCGCNMGKIIQDRERISDFYTPKEIAEMGEDSNKELDATFTCANCDQELIEVQ